MVENSRGREITVRVKKFAGVEYRRWPARVIGQEGSLIVLDAVFAEEVEHNLLGNISAGTMSKEYYWLDRWYNVFRFSDPRREGIRFYCNVNQPPSFADTTLTYVDLDIDVLVEADFSYKVLDLEDFAAYPYPAEVQRQAREALAELIDLIESRSFPFNE